MTAQTAGCASFQVPSPDAATTPTTPEVAACLTDDSRADDCVTVVFYPGDEGAVLSISPWFCSAESARLLLDGDNCSACGDDLTDAGDDSGDHECDGGGPETVWFYLKADSTLTAEEVASWFDCGDPYESAGRVAAVQSARAILEAP